MKKGIYLLLIILGCAVHEPQETLSPPKGEEIKKILENIRKYSFKVKIEITRPGVKSTVHGVYTKRGRVRVKSEWEIDGKKIQKESLVIGGKTFLKKGDKWIEGSGSERLPYELILTVTSFSDFSFVESKKGCFIYRFTPNLLFISPSIESTEAKIYIDQHTLLPVNIVAAGDGGCFNAKLSCFGEDIKIEHPLSKVYETEISPIPNTKDMGIITERILSIGADDCWLRNNRLYIKIPETNEGDIKRLLKKGVIYIYKATYPKEPLDTAISKYGNKLVFLSKANSVLIDSLLYKGSVKDVDFFEGEVRGDRIALRFHDDITLLIPCVVSIDDRPVSFFQKFCGNEMKVRGDKVDYSILKFGPLSREYEIR